MTPARVWRAEREARKLDDLTALLLELVELGIPGLPGVAVTLRDAIPRVLFTGPGWVMDVQVGEDGRRFVCRPPVGDLVTSDVAGAAEVVAGAIRLRVADPASSAER